MREYIVVRYRLDVRRTCVCVNGSDWVDTSIDTDYRRTEQSGPTYVYAGTLNKGRSIEEMVRIFMDTNTKLILMGPHGEWIGKFARGKRTIRYLGAMAEQVAHRVCSLCDVGLIPYDETRFYYNIAFPTKLSFYVTAGIGVLSTPVAEVARMAPLCSRIVMAPMREWRDLIGGGALERRVRGGPDHCELEAFTWRSTLAPLIDLIGR